MGTQKDVSAQGRFALSVKTRRMSSMAINVQLLQQTLAEVEKAAKRRGKRAWHQAHYRCHTGMCFAGHGVELAGLKWRSNEVHDEYVIGPRGVDYCSAAMRDAFGLSVWEADALFQWNNTLDDLREMVNAIATIAEIDPEAVE